MNATWNLSSTAISGSALQTVICSSSHASCNHLLVYSTREDDWNTGVAKMFCMPFCPGLSFFFPSCHPGSLPFPSAMRAVWEVGAGFSALCLVVWSEAEHLPSAMQPMCQAAHLAHPILFNDVASYSSSSFFYSQKSYSLCFKLKQMFTLHAYYHTVSPSKAMEKNSGGIVSC